MYKGNRSSANIQCSQFAYNEEEKNSVQKKTKEKKTIRKAETCCSMYCRVEPSRHYFFERAANQTKPKQKQRTKRMIYHRKNSVMNECTTMYSALICSRRHGKWFIHTSGHTQSCIDHILSRWIFSSRSYCIILRRKCQTNDKICHMRRPQRHSQPMGHFQINNMFTSNKWNRPRSIHNQWTRENLSFTIDVIR